MLNKNLFDSPKDCKIASLSLAVRRFKAYDEKRKAYVKQLEKDKQWLEEELAEQRGGRELALITKVKNQSRQLTNMTIALRRRNLADSYTDEQIAQWRADIDAVDTHELIEKLKRENLSLHTTNSELVAKIITLQQNNNTQA